MTTAAQYARMHKDDPRGRPQWDAARQAARPGDRIRLRFWGDRAVPLCLGGTYATLLEILPARPGKPQRWRVRADEDAYGERTIEPGKHVAYLLSVADSTWYRFF